MIKYSPKLAQFINLLSGVIFFAALMVNGLANLLPINGLATGEISDTYANYFAPTGLTFSIWSVIYISLTAYVLWRFKNLGDTSDNPKNRHLFHIDLAFLISSIANGLWILSWHYLQFYVSFFMMIVILTALIYINLAFKGDQSITTIPFRIYFGWITVATVANATTMIVADSNRFSWIWNGGEVSQQIMATIILVVTILIGLVTLIRQKDLYFGGVIVWALFGIYLRHTMDYPNYGIVGLANTALLGLVLTLLGMVFVSNKKILKILKKS